MVVGVSIGSPATPRFRRRMPGGFDRASLRIAPRSAYRLAGEARHDTASPRGDQLRFSITFRTLSDLGGRKAAQD